MLKLAKDRQSELAEVEGVELGKHNSTSVDTSSVGRVTLTSYATNSVNPNNPNQCLVSVYISGVYGERLSCNHV